MRSIVGRTADLTPVNFGRPVGDQALLQGIMPTQARSPKLPPDQPDECIKHPWGQASMPSLMRTTARKCPEQLATSRNVMGLQRAGAASALLTDLAMRVKEPPGRRDGTAHLPVLAGGQMRRWADRFAAGMMPGPVSGCRGGRGT